MKNKELQEILKQFPDDVEIVKARRSDDGRYIHHFYDECDVLVRMGKDLPRWGEPKDGLIIEVKQKKD